MAPEIPPNSCSGVTIGPADPALQGAPFQGGAKLLENVGHFSENLTVVLAKIRALGYKSTFFKDFYRHFHFLSGFGFKGNI